MLANQLPRSQRHVEATSNIGHRAQITCDMNNSSRGGLHSHQTLKPCALHTFSMLSNRTLRKALAGSVETVESHARQSYHPCYRVGAQGARSKNGRKSKLDIAGDVEIMRPASHFRFLARLAGGICSRS